MRARALRQLSLALLLASTPLLAQSEDACTLPGVLVSEDAAGDDLLAATGEGFADIRSLHIAEPAGSNHLVITYKMSDLGQLPPNTLWIFRFLLDALPANGDAEYFVAMLTGPDATPYFVHGTAGAADDDASGQAPLAFTPAGTLEPQSNFSADGTITLVLDKSKIEGLVPGAPVYGMIPMTHRITPTDGTQPFAYGFRSVSGNLVAYDDATDGFYEITGNACEDSKSGLLGAGALPLLGLSLMLAAGLSRRRRQ